MRSAREVLERLLRRIEEGSKTVESCLLYAAEYDRVHGTDVARRLRQALKRREQASVRPVSAGGRGSELGD